MMRVRRMMMMMMMMMIKARTVMLIIAMMNKVDMMVRIRFTTVCNQPSGSVTSLGTNDQKLTEVIM